MNNLLKSSNIKFFTLFFSIALYIFLLIKIQFIDKTILLSDSVLIKNCSDFSIFYLFENLFSFQNVRITFVDLNKTIHEQFNLFRIVDNELYPAFFLHQGKKYILKIFEEEN